MLTGDLLRVRVKGKALTPSLIDPAKPALVEAATELHAAFSGAAEEAMTRGEIDEQIRDLIGERADHKIIKGLAKVAMDRSTFETESPIPPPELRDRVFRAAAAAGPLALTTGPLDRTTAHDVLAEVGAALDLTAERVADLLYADLKQEQRLQSFDVPDGTWLLNRYNVSLVQSVLLKATSVTVKLEAPSQPRLRQLLRYVKFNQLIFAAEPHGKKGVTLTLDGPLSLFKQSTRYGMQLARFLPALLLQECPWTLTAEVLWTRRKHRKKLEITHNDGLVSHYRDRGAYKTREQDWFEERFAATDTDWTLSEGRAPLHLGGRAVVLPDYTLTATDGRVAHLEIVGFWRKDWLQRRLELLARFGPGTLILAVSKKLMGDEKLADLPQEVLPFAQIVPVKDVLAAAERVAQR